jgi:hypothetical protein
VSEVRVKSGAVSPADRRFSDTEPPGRCVAHFYVIANNSQ